MLGNIQIEVLRLLHDSKQGISIEELLKNWKYREGGIKSIEGLRARGFIRINRETVHFVRFPTEIEVQSGTKTFSMDELEEFNDINRRNLVYLYRGELKEVESGHLKRVSIPEGVRKQLKLLGVIKWKMLSLTDLGHKLLGEVMTTGF